MSKPKEEYNVTVLDRQDITTFPKLGQAEVWKYITYVAAGLPPKTIQIKKDEWTVEKEKRAIRDDIDARMKARPESYMV